MKIFLICCFSALALSLSIGVLHFNPKKITQEEVVCQNDAPLLPHGNLIKIMSWNVQYMAGKNHVFFYDSENGSDSRPSSEELALTLEEVARVISSENPDIVLLQELDDGARRSDYQDQLALLLDKFSNTYKCHTQSYYWKSPFVPHPKILGPVGMKLGILSKYKLDRATRFQLPIMKDPFFIKIFQFKRAMLRAVLPTTLQQEFSVYTTHFDAFAQGSPTMRYQVEYAHQILSADPNPFVIGGDFNLLPPNKSSYAKLDTESKKLYNPQSEIKLLFESFQAKPSLLDQDTSFYTHLPNGKTMADRTIDYFFASKNVKISSFQVRQRDTKKISDHFPLVMRIYLNTYK